MEIEAKYRLSGADQAAMIAVLRQIGPFMLEPEAEVERQRNQYYDTADRRLRTLGYGLRVRDIDGQLTATLKGPATVVGAVSSREEIEHAVPSHTPEMWPAGGIVNRLRLLIGSLPLYPTVVIHANRQHLYAVHAERRVADVSIDIGEFQAGTRRQAFYELEIELVGDGTPADLDELTALFAAQYALEPEPLSKLARALRLADHGP